MTLADDKTKTAIARVNELARAARAGWLSLLFALVFVTVTLAGVEDVDFYIPERQTPLPLVGVSIPTYMFFVLTPALIAALYANLHFHLLKLWAALSPGRLPAQVGGVPVSDHLTASFIVDLGLHFRRDGALRKRDLRLLTSVLTFFLVFALGPMVMGWAWVRSMRSLDEVLTVVFCGLPFAFILHVMMSSLVTIWTRCSCNRLRCRGLKRWLDRAPGRSGRRAGTRLVVLLLVVSLFGWIRTEGWFPTYRLSDGWTYDTVWPKALASPRFVNIIVQSENYQQFDYVEHVENFRSKWCKELDLPQESCPEIKATPALTLDFLVHDIGDFLPSERQVTALEAYDAASDKAYLDWCFESFNTSERTLCNYRNHIDNLRFRRSLQSSIENLAKKQRLTLIQDRDLRGAVFLNSDFSSVDFSKSRLSGAKFENTILDWSSFSGVDLRESFISGTSGIHVNFGEADFTRAEITFSRFPHAKFFHASMTDSVFQANDASFSDLFSARTLPRNVSGSVFVMTDDWIGLSDEFPLADGASFEGYRFFGEINGGSFRRSYFSNSWIHASFKNSRLSGSHFSNSVILDSTFMNSTLAEALFSFTLVAATRFMDDDALKNAFGWRNSAFAFMQLRNSGFSCSSIDEVFLDSTVLGLECDRDSHSISSLPIERSLLALRDLPTSNFLLEWEDWMATKRSNSLSRFDN